MNYGKIAVMRLRRSIALALISNLALTSALALLASGPTSASETKATAKKTAKPIPSPSPKWPPKGFKGNQGVYAKVPTSKELIGLLSAKRTLQSVVKNCEKYACGAVIAAAETGCLWWEVNSSVFSLRAEDLSKQRIGTLTTITGGSEKREQKTIFLVSTADVVPGVSISGIKVTCHRDKENKPKNGNVYQPLVIASATPEVSPNQSEED